MGCMTCHQEHAAMETCAECEFDAFVRNHFFTGKMMGAAEFATETLYHSDKMRHHNARLHGSGAVCGLKVHEHPSTGDCQKRYVVVTPGSALDCCGREILVAQEEIVDVAEHRDVARLRGDARAHTLQVCVAFRECPTEEVPVLYDECGCDDTKCAPNRILESFRFDVLVDPPLPSADLVGKAPLGAFVATDRHGVTGFSRASVAGKVLAADPGSGAAGLDPAQPTRLFVIDTRFRSMKTITLPSPARAAALSADGNFVFVVTGSRTSIFKVDDGSEIVPAAPAELDIPGAGTGALYAAAGTDESGFIAYVPGSGDAYRWKADSAKGLDGATRQKVTLEANLSGVTASRDGKVVYGITGSNKVRQYTIAASGSSTSKEFAPTVNPSALAAFELGATPKPMLAVASRADQRVYLIDLNATPSPVTTTIDLDRPPAQVGAAGGGDDVWLHVLEEASAHLYTQAVSLKPLTATPAGQPLLAAPRLAEDGTRAIVLVFPEGQAGVIHPAALADSDCADHLWKQLEGCPACELPDCVVLATIANYQPGMTLANASIDNRLGRRVVASTATLQAWLQCLQLKGGIPGPKGDPGQNGINGTNGTNGTDGEDGEDGEDGKDGIGLYTSLPKILDIGWRLEEEFNVIQFLNYYQGLALNLTTANVETRVRELVKGGKPPPLTIYFNKKLNGITRRTLGATIDAPWATKNAQGQFESNGLYLPLTLKLYGRIIETIGPVPTPHTNEQAAYAVSLVLPETFFVTKNQNGQTQPALPYILLVMLTYLCASANLDKPRVLVDLRGDFVYAPAAGDAYDEFGVLDGNNVGGRVGLPPPEARKPPILGGNNPSGNLTQGGLFESWFLLTARDSHVPAPEAMVEAVAAATASPLAAAFGRAPAAMRFPPTANFASVDEIAALPGVSRPLAQRIVKAREAKPIEGLADLKKRAHISDADWEKLKPHLTVL